MIQMRMAVHRTGTAICSLLLAAATSLPAQELPAPRPAKPLNSSVPSWLQRWSRVNQRSSSLVKSIFRDVIAESRACTVRISCDGERAALGTIVSARGFVLTKASEMRGDIICTLADGVELPAVIVGIRDDYDLAMLKISGGDLTPARWSKSPEPVPGSWLATPGHGTIPIAIGVVSASSREIAPPRGVLGVLLGTGAGGPQITSVLPESGAAAAGLHEGDIVVSVDGREVSDVAELISRIQQLRPGAEIELDILRGNDPLEIVATLGEATITEEGARTEYQKGLGRKLSKRNAGFPKALQHDSVLRPSDCGGPLVNLDGQVVAVNIASADRVTSYAIPTSTVLPMLPKLMSGSLAPEDARKQLKDFLARASELQATLDERLDYLKKMQELVTQAEASGRSAKATLEKSEENADAQAQFEKARARYQQAKSEIQKTQDELVDLRQTLSSLPTHGVELNRTRPRPVDAAAAVEAGS